MVKKRGKKNRGGGGNKIALESAVDSDPELAKKSQSWMNPMDQAEDEDEKSLQRKLQRKNPRGRAGRNDSGGGEMFAISDSDSEYEVPTMKSILKKRKEEEENDDKMNGAAFSDSDLDEGDDGGEATLPEDMIGGDAWGKRKKYFYGGNPNDPHFKDKNHVDGDDSDLDEAALEAKESQKLQMKQLEQMDEDDFFDAFSNNSPKESKKKKTKKYGVEHREKILLDLSKLTKKEKLKLFAQESPEFEGILGDLDEKLEEAKKLQPIAALITEGKIPEGPATDLIKTKYQIILK